MFFYDVFAGTTLVAGGFKTVKEANCWLNKVDININPKSLDAKSWTTKAQCEKQFGLIKIIKR